LASLAQQWSDRCIDEYGNIPFDSHDVRFNVLGQNNWVGSAAGGHVHMYGVVNDWFSEIHDYNYERDRCASGKSCTDYTQVIMTYAHRSIAGLLGYLKSFLELL